MTGMPASLTTSTVAPPLISSTSAGHPRRLVLVEQADHLAGDPDLEACASVRTRRVSSAATTSALPRAADQPGGGVGGQPQRGGRQQQSTGAHSAQPTIGRVTATATESPSAARSVPVISPGAADARRRLRARRPAERLDDDRGHHCAGGDDPVPQPRLADRRGHPDLRREALRAAGLADAVQPRRRGQPRLRAGGAPAGRQAIDRDRRGDLRLQRAGLAVHRRGAAASSWSRWWRASSGG